MPKVKENRLAEFAIIQRCISYILECEEAAEAIEAGDQVSVDFDTGVISNLTTGKTWQAEPFPEFIQNIIQKGGLLASLK